MVKSMFAAVAGLRAHQSKMDIIGNNIANVNTYGYKAARATFRDVYYATTSGAGEPGAIYGGTNPSQTGYGSKLASIDSLMTGGGAAATSSSLDCMIVGNGFFLVGRKPTDYTEDDYEGIEIGVGGDDADAARAGTVDQTEISGLSLTRVGIFNFDGSGNMVDSNGNVVYGFASRLATAEEIAADETLSEGSYVADTSRLIPLRMPNRNTEEGDDAAYEAMELSNITIGKDGTVTGMNDEKQTVVIGKLALANVPNPNALERAENSYYNAKGNTGTITVNPSGQNSTGTIAAGYLEMSNVDLSNEFTDMITTQRGFQANTRIITVTDSMLEELVNMKR